MHNNNYFSQSFNKIYRIVRIPNITLLILFILTFLVRIYKINSFPVGITFDHMDYVLNAKSIWYTGSDVTGTWNPLSLTSIKTAETAISEIFPIILAPLIGPAPLTFFWVRLPYVLASSLLVVFLYLITKKLINSNVGIIAAILMMVNPWGNHFGRTSFESPVAILFFLIAFYQIILYKDGKILRACLFLILGFFTYHPMKILYFPLCIVYLGIHLFYHRLKFQLIHGVFLLICLLPLIFFLRGMQGQAAASRKTEFFLYSPNLDAVSAVNDERRLSIPTHFNKLLTNKPVYYIKHMLSQFFGAYSPYFLFFTGDTSGIGAYTTWQHGIFYYIDIFLVCLGIAYLYQKKPRNLIIIALILIIGPIPSMASFGAHYVHRSGIIIPFLLIIIATGMYAVLKKLKTKRIFLMIFISFYLLLVINYYYLYFLRYPVYGSDGYALDKRILSSYISRVKGVKVYITTQKPRPIFEQYLFYSGIYNSKKNIKEIAGNMTSHNYNYGNVYFSDDCPDLDTLNNPNIISIIEASYECDKNNLLNKQNKRPHLSISSLVDTGQIFKIYNDRMCSEYPLSLYSRVNTDREFAMEKMNNEDFCKKWINDFSKLEI